MKETFIIKLKTRNKKVLKLNRSYSEFLRFNLTGGGDIFAEFDFVIQPNPKTKNEVVISIEAKKEEHTKTIRAGISKAINEIVQKYNERGIDVYGLILQIKNHRFHNIDSKPAGYEYPFKKRIYELIEENLFDRISENFENVSSIFKIEEIINFDKQKAYYPSNSIYLSCPIIKEETLVFNRDWKSEVVVIDEDHNVEEIKLEMTIISLFKKRRENKIAISYGKDVEPFITNSITNQIDEFKNSIYQKGLNLGGLTFFIECKGKWKNQYHPQRKFNSTRWLLENIISNKENFEIEKMKPVANNGYNGNTP